MIEYKLRLAGHNIVILVFGHFHPLFLIVKVTTAWFAHSFGLNKLVPVGHTVDKCYSFMTTEALFLRFQLADAVIDRYSQNLPQGVSSSNTQMRSDYTRIRYPSNLHAMHDSGILLPVPHHLKLVNLGLSIGPNSRTY